MTDKPFDAFAHDYDELLKDPLRDRFASDSDFFIRQKCRVVERRLRSMFSPGKSLRVLDAGCGLGRALSYFNTGIRAFGSDVSQAMLRHAAGRPVVVQESFDLPFADGTFDAAYAFCIYHHMPDEHHVRHLRELRRVVAPGGEVMVFEHNPHNPVTARIFARAPIDRGCHMTPPATLRSRFREAGFANVTHGYLLFVPESFYPALGFLERALQWLPLGGQYFVAGRNVR